MPPRGRKAFVSRAAAAARAAAGSDGSPSDGDTAPAAVPPKTDAPAPAPPEPAAPPPAPDDEERGPETRGQMVQRHKRVSKREMKAQKEMSKRMGKKRKDEAAAAEAALAAKHAAELAALEADAGDADGADGPAAAADALARFGVSDDAPPSAAPAVRKTSRAARRRADKAARDAEREAERDAERAAAAAAPSARGEEAAALEKTLASHSLTLVDIPPDGHCLYASLADQLTRAGRGDGGGVAGLRAAAAERLRAAADHFAPFIEDVDGVDAGAAADDPAARVAAYADAVEHTAAWGGHCELAALAAALGVRVRVITAGAAPTCIDGDAGGAAPAPPDAPTLTVAYMRHAYGLGEHYNSTKERVEGKSGEEDDEEEQGGANDGDVWSGSE